MKKYLMTIVMLTLAAMPVWAERIHPKAGTTSAPFLKLGVGARAISLAQSFCALSDDATAPEWNPAGTSNLMNQQIVAMHHMHFQNITQEYFGYVYPTRDYSMGISVRGLIYPKDLERRSGLGEDVPEEPLTGYVDKFGGNDISIALNISRKVHEYLIAGGNLKFIRQKIDTETGSTFAVDLGLLGSFSDDWGEIFRSMSWGAVVQNFGPGIKFIDESYDLPLNLKTGIAYRMLEEKINFACDYNHAIDNYPYLSAGVEWNFAKAMSLRTGYRYKFYGNDLGDLSGLTAGVGVKYFNDSSLDYAFMPQGDLGNTHRISMSINFGRKLKIPVKPVKEIKIDEVKTRAVFNKMDMEVKLRKIALRRQFVKITISPNEDMLLDKITCDAEFQAGARYPFSVEYAEMNEMDMPAVRENQVFLEGVELKHNLDAVNVRNARLYFKVKKDLLERKNIFKENVFLTTGDNTVIIPEKIEDAGSELIFEYRLPGIKGLGRFFIAAF